MIEKILLLKNVPKLNFTVSEILLSYPLYFAGGYKLEGKRMDVFYLYTRARSEMFPLVILAEPGIFTCDSVPPAPARTYSDVTAIPGPFRIAIKNRETKFTWGCRDDGEIKETNKSVQAFIHRAKGPLKDPDRAPRLVISGQERWAMTNTYREVYTMFPPAEDDLVLVEGCTSRRFANCVSVFITRRQLPDLLRTARPARYVPSPAQMRMGLSEKVFVPRIQ